MSEILEMLEKGIKWEDEFIAKYDNEEIWELLETLPEDKFEKIKKLFRENIDDTKKHYKILSELIKKIKGGKNDS